MLRISAIAATALIIITGAAWGQPYSRSGVAPPTTLNQVTECRFRIVNAQPVVENCDGQLELIGSSGVGQAGARFPATAVPPNPNAPRSFVRLTLRNLRSAQADGGLSFSCTAMGFNPNDANFRVAGLWTSAPTGAPPTSGRLTAPGSLVSPRDARPSVFNVPRDASSGPLSLVIQTFAPNGDFYFTGCTVRGRKTPSTLATQ